MRKIFILAFLLFNKVNAQTPVKKVKIFLHYGKEEVVTKNGQHFAISYGLEGHYKKFEYKIGYLYHPMYEQHPHVSIKFNLQNHRKHYTYFTNH